MYVYMYVCMYVCLYVYWHVLSIRSSMYADMYCVFRHLAIINTFPGGVPLKGTKGACRPTVRLGVATHVIRCAPASRRLRGDVCFNEVQTDLWAHIPDIPLRLCVVSAF